MKAIILVGGEGTRMRPLTYHTPKPLLPICNVPFIVRQINWLASHGITEVTLSLGYLPHAFEEYFAHNPCSGVTVSYVVEEHPLGTAGAIKFAAGDVNEPIVVCNGDVLTDLSLGELISFHNERKSDATIALTYVEDPSAFGVVPTQDDGEVIAFVEKPPRETAPSHWINAGTYILTPKFLELIPEGLTISIERETFPLQLHNDVMYAYESDAYWLDIGTPQQYVRAHTDLLSQGDIAIQEGLSLVAENIFSSGEVQIGRDVRALSPCVVGPGTIIGDRVTLDAATLGERCVIGAGSEVVSSVLHSGVILENNVFLSTSIVGESSNIGDSVRLDEHSIVGAFEKVEPHTSARGERIGSEV